MVELVGSYSLLGWRSQRTNEARELDQYEIIFACVVDDSASNHAPQPNDIAPSTSPRKPQITRVNKLRGSDTPIFSAKRNRILPANPVHRHILKHNRLEKWLDHHRSNAQFQWSISILIPGCAAAETLSLLSRTLGLKAGQLLSASTRTTISLKMSTSQRPSRRNRKASVDSLRTRPRSGTCDSPASICKTTC